MSTNQIDILQSKLQAYKRKYYLNLAIRGLIITLAFLSTVYVCFVIFEHFAQSSSAVRTALFYSFIGMLMTTAGIWVILPIVRLYKLGNNLSDEEASSQIGNFFPEIKDRLLNTLQLGRLSVNDSGLLAATIEQRTRELSTFSFADAINIKENRRFLKWIIFPGTIIMVLLISNYDMISGSTDRLLNYSEDRTPQAPFEFVIQDDALSAFRNENFELRIELDGDPLPETVYVIVDGRKRELNRIDSRNYSFDFGPIKNSFDFHLEAAGFPSKEYSVQLKNRPEIANFDIMVEYPAYLNRKSEQFKNSGNLTIPEGSKLHWIISSQYTDSVKFKFSGNAPINVPRISEETFEFVKTIRNSSEYEVMLANPDSKNREKILYQLNVIKDEYPTISIEQYQDSVLFSYLLLGGSFNDDYGFTQARFYYNFIDTDGKTKFPNFKSQPIYIKRDQNNQNFFHQLELDSLALSNGETIQYYVKVWDNDGFNGPKSAQSRMFKFQMPNNEQIKESIEKSMETSENQIDKSFEKAKEVKKNIDKLYERIKSKKNIDWQDKKLIEDMLKEHKELTKEIEQMQENFKEQTKKSERFNKEDQELKQKAEMLQKLMDELMDEETKKLYEELQKLMEEQVKQEDIQKLLEKMKDQDEVAEKELERALEMFKQLKFEQQLDQAVEELKELAKEQEQLSKETEEKGSDLEEIKEKQEDIQKKFDEVKEDIKELEKLNESMENPNDMESTEQEQKNVDEQLNKSNESLSKGKKSQSSENQKNSAEEMQKLAQKMESMQQDMQSQQMEEDLNALREILENLVTLSFDQEELMNNFKEVNQSDPRFIELSQQQLKLQDDAQIIEDSLYSLAKRVFEIQSFVTREVTEMNKQMDRSVTSIQQRNPKKAAGQQQAAMTSMNNLALLLDDVMQQMQQQMGQQKAGDQMCNKPGNGKSGQSGKPKLGDMQKQLNQMIQNLKNGNKSGRQLSEELAKLAAQQEAIRRALQKMESEMKKNGQNDGSKLGELQKKMEETEEDLVNKQITPETIERQKEILTRLLEAEKSLRERDYEEKREAQQAKEKERKTPANFEKYIKTKEKQIELLKTIPPSLTPYYKREVNEYFQKIEN